jgi:diacylglycerol kinase family enzyme
MDDGLLEVLAIQATDGAGFDDLVKAVMERRHLEHPLAAYTRGQRVEVVAPEGLLAEVDGDLWERELYEVSVTCRPGVLPLAVAAASSS